MVIMITCSRHKNMETGSCNASDHSLHCLEEKCLSMVGCDFTPGNPKLV